jgi:hypothetical protein
MYLSGATTVQPRPEEDQTGWHAIDRKQQKVFRTLYFHVKSLLNDEYLTQGE